MHLYGPKQNRTEPKGHAFGYHLLRGLEGSRTLRFVPSTPKKNVHLRLDPDEHAAIQQAAENKGMKVTAFIRQAARAFAGLEAALTELPKKREPDQ